MDCGPACLKIIARHFGKYYSLQHLLWTKIYDFQKSKMIRIFLIAISFNFYAFLYAQTGHYDKLGIGTAFPAENLHVIGNTIITGVIKGESTSSGTIHTSSIYPYTINVNTAADAGNIVLRSGSTPGQVTTLNVTGGGNGGGIQFSTRNTEIMRITNDGKIGIGTTNPIKKFHIAGTSDVLRIGPVYPDVDRDYIDIFAHPTDTRITSNNERFHIENLTGHLVFQEARGNIGIGISNPFTTLMLVRVVNGVNSARIGFFGQTGEGNNKDNGGVRFINDNSPYYSEVAGFRGLDSEQAGLRFYTASNSSPSVQMTIFPNGNVGIGNAEPNNYKLNVWGKIRAHEVVVNTTGADFVFDPAYKLPELGELEKYIIENRHLPDIEPASDMRANGVNVSDLQMKLLQKIEEMSLYIIEQHKKIQGLEKKFQSLERASNTLNN